MKCPQCKSENVMTIRTHTKERVIVDCFFWKTDRKKEENTLSYECSDCGNEWEDEG